MCGHVGVAGEITKKDEDIFKQLLIVDSLRGTDSTGVAAISRYLQPIVAKSVGNPFELFDRKSFDTAMRSINRALIGHNRFSTVGNSTVNNAHPFEFETIIGAHNGTLTNKWAFDEGNSFDVDSQALFNHIDKKGLRDAINIAKGAYALVWWDKMKESINFLRNSERTLWMTRSDDGKVIYWASELGMLELVLDRNGVKYEDPHFFNQDFHYSIVIGKDGKMEKPVLTEMKKALPAITNIVDISSKKTGVTPSSSKHFDVSYKPEGHIEVEITANTIDKHGSRFFQCVDWESPLVDIRLYYNKLDFNPDDIVGECLPVIIHPIPYAHKDVKFWKVNYSSVNWDDVKKDKEETVILDQKGNPISHQEFVNKYGECVWCSGFVNPEGKHAITEDGQGVCSECCDDHHLSSYVKYAGSIRNK